MKTLAVIPARLGATRLPRKPLRLLGGVPLVLRVWERVRQMHVADECVIATDSAEVAAIAADYGAGVVLTRGDHPSGTDRVAEVAERSEFRPMTAGLETHTSLLFPMLGFHSAGERRTPAVKTS